MRTEGIPAPGSGRFPLIEFVAGPIGGRRSRVHGGLAVWEYILAARELNWDPAATGQHLERVMHLVSVQW